MRISDLSDASGVPIATIKFYLREGILPAGRRTAPNQARYDESHLGRLRLVRVLVEVGGLSLAAVRRVLGALGDEDLPLTEVLGLAHHALAGETPGLTAELADAQSETDAWLAARGWDITPEAPARRTLAATLIALRRLGWRAGPEVFERYAEAADALAGEELEYVGRSESRAAALEATVIGTVAFERALVALRRLAQEHHSRRRFGRTAQ